MAAADQRQATALERIADALEKLIGIKLDPPEVLDKAIEAAMVGVEEPEVGVDVPAVSKETEAQLIAGGLTDAQAGELTGEVKRRAKR